MILLLSPSKTLDENSPFRADKVTQPEFLKDSELLVNGLRELSVAKIRTLMEVSEKIAALNHARFENFHTPFTSKNARPALCTFKGDVYTGMDVEHYTAADFTFAQKHVRILSGLYGLLRPLDLMQPYRLEMGRKFKTSHGKDLYTFWGDRITGAINAAVKSSASKAVINLASEEYFKAVRPRLLDVPCIDIVFKEKKGKDLKVIGLFAKKARGMMADYVIRERVKKTKELQSFDRDGYRFQPHLSTPQKFVFIR